MLQVKRGWGEGGAGVVHGREGRFKGWGCYRFSVCVCGGGGVCGQGYAMWGCTLVCVCARVRVEGRGVEGVKGEMLSQVGSCGSVRGLSRGEGYIFSFIFAKYIYS